MRAIIPLLIKGLIATPASEREAELERLHAVEEISRPAAAPEGGAGRGRGSGPHPERPATRDRISSSRA